MIKNYNHKTRITKKIINKYFFCNSTQESNKSNPFIEIALSTIFSLLTALNIDIFSHSNEELIITVLADNDFYSQREQVRS